MSFNVKSYSVTGHDVEEPEFRDAHGALPLGKGDNMVHKILHSFIKGRNNRFINITTNAVRRATNHRVSSGSSGEFGDDIGHHIHEDEKRQHVSERVSGPLVSGLAYCISSCSMILLNKIVLSSYGFDAGISLMFYQNFVCVMVVIALEFFGVVSTERFSLKLIKVWVPVNLIFVGMLVTGMYSLKYINIALVTILKNVTNILTAVGEAYIFRRRQNKKVWTTLTLMLTLRQVMDTAKQSTRSGSLNEISMVLLNNALSLPFAILLILIFGEWEYVYNSDVIRMPMFWVLATASGLLGLAISFTSLWFLNQTGPTTYSLVGSLNKIPISIAGILLFKVPLSLPNLFSILFGLFAGVFFARAKMS